MKNLGSRLELEFTKDSEHLTHEYLRPAVGHLLWIIGCCSNHIFILDLTPGFNEDKTTNLLVFGFGAPYIKVLMATIQGPFYWEGLAKSAERLGQG